MSENQESQENEAASTPTSQSTSAPTSPSATSKKSASSKKIQAPSKTYGKLKLPLLLEHEHVLRVASVFLERAGEEIYSHEDLHDLAMERFMEYLKVKKGLDFKEIFAKKLPSSK